MVHTQMLHRGDKYRRRAASASGKSSSAPARSRPGPSRSGFASRKAVVLARDAKGRAIRSPPVRLPAPVVEEGRARRRRRRGRAHDDAAQAGPPPRPRRLRATRNRRRADGVASRAAARASTSTPAHARRCIGPRPIPEHGNAEASISGWKRNEPSTTRTSLAGSATSATRAPSMIERESRPVARPPRINRAKLTQKFPLGYALVYLAPGLTSYRV